MGWGYVNQKGEEIGSFTYQYASTFGESGLAIVEAEGAYGCMNSEGEIVVEPEYENIGTFVKVK